MHYHIVGIAGAGMSAIAQLLLDQGHMVSGSDLHTNRLTTALVERGAVVHRGHDPSHVVGADALIATSAVQANHPEVVAAQDKGIAVLKRTDIWRIWSQERFVIAVAGTHGKTTTTAMLTLALVHVGIDAGFLIGAEFPQLGTHARWGDPQAPLVIEADEYDRTFLALTPDIAVVTYVEWDHPDCYATEETYNTAFIQFLSNTHKHIVVSEQAMHISNKMVRHRSQHQKPKTHIVTYGLQEGLTYRAIPSDDGRVHIYKHPSNGSGDTPTPAPFTTFSLAVPGVHNICNALAAVAVLDILGLDCSIAIQGLQHYRGVARRFELKGDSGGVTVVDDYAHHPSEVAATLQAARSLYGQRRIVAYVQPHTFSRTHALLDAWPQALKNADVVLVGAIFASRESGQAFLTETNPEEALALHLCERITDHGITVTYVGTVEQATAIVLPMLKAGDVLITMGAGDGFLVGERVLHALRNTC